jgi:hypothetical protein
MIIRVVDKAVEPPVSDQDGALVWEGGHQVGSAGGEALSASVLSGLYPELEVGTWYKFQDLKSLFSSAKASDAPLWTTLGIQQVGVDGKFEATMEINAEAAASLIARGLISHCENLPNQNFWVRIE